MDRFAQIELFVRIVERRSFSAASAELGISRPAATAAIQQLEERLAVRLLQRSTRHVSPTVEGSAYYRRCLAILADIEDADSGAAGDASGLIRVDVVGNLAREILLPRLGEFLDEHPSLDVHLGEGERFVDLVREGVDCVVRAGEPTDSDMIIRRLGVVHEATCASPAYLAAHGVPATPDDLDGHVMVGFVSSRTRRPLPLEFTRDGHIIEVELPARLLVRSADTSAAAALLGLGIVQAPRFRFEEDFIAGRLVEILADTPPTPTPIAILYPSNRQLSPRVRIFIDWLIKVIVPRLT